MIFELSEIKRIIKSNTSKNNYTKHTYIKICDDELFRLNELVGLVVTEVNEAALSIDKCIDYLKVNPSNLNREQVILFQSINVNCSCTVCPECKEPDTAGFFCSKCIPL